MIKSLLFIFFLVFISCSSNYIRQVHPNTKTELGFEITAPNQSVFFVENEKIKIKNKKVNKHIAIAGSMYNKYGPAKDDFFIGRTNARDLKFNLATKTYYIVVDQLPKRTAMIIFDGKHKPIVVFNPKKYNKFIAKIEKK